MKNIRSPICSILAHVDHGKTSILDKIRGSAITAGEAGGITQAIGASIIPLKTIKKVCGDLLLSLKMDFTIPGLLFIDTPGHAAFSNLRRRGGNLADIAILVIDINEGIKPQTLESIEILKGYKTPFIIAANKIDLLSGWQNKEGMLLKKIASQSTDIQQLLDKKIYEILGKLSELGFDSERFDRVEDYTKKIAIVPTSAKTGEGIPELLMVLSGMAQKFLEKCLECDVCSDAKGTILEIKEDKGMGTTIDAIIYDGCLKVNDTIVIATLSEPIVTKVRALFEPKPLSEMRDKKGKFDSVKEVQAATGVKISAPGIERAIAGMPIRGVGINDLDKIKKEIKKEIEEIIIETDHKGIVIKADTLGSLEALIKLLKEKDVQIKRASIGNISKKDISDAAANFDDDPLQSIVLGFNVDYESQEKENVKVITNSVIYKLIEDFEGWQIDEKKRLEGKELDQLIRPCKVELMKGYIFRQNNPAIVGVDVLAGKIKTKTPLMKKDGIQISEVKTIQADKDSVEEAERGKQVAISLPGVTVGRQIVEGDILYSAIPEDHFRKLKEYKTYLSQEEKEILKEIAELKRKDNPVWGV